MSTGQDDFRFKTKNQNEECLFKNEDEMYQTDHKILQLAHSPNNLDLFLGRQQLSILTRNALLLHATPMVALLLNKPLLALI